MKIASITSVVVGFCVLLGTAVAGPKDEFLNRFDDASRRAICESAPSFVRVNGVLWDRQVEKERDKVKRRVDAVGSIEKLSIAMSAQAKRYGLHTKNNCRQVPLWFSLTAVPGRYTADGGTWLTDDDEIRRMSNERPEGRTYPKAAWIVCEKILDNGEAIAHFRVQNPDYWQEAIKRSGSNTANEVPAYVDDKSFRFRVVGFAFQTDGETRDARGVYFKDGPVYKTAAGESLATLERATLQSERDMKSEVDADELAKAIIDGKAELSTWSWFPNAEGGEWKRVARRLGRKR